MSIRFVSVKSATAAALRIGPDAYGLLPEIAGPSDGTGTPCRHCLSQVPAGQPFVIVAYRPFEGLNPYTETGPIFLCAQECAAGGPDFPAAMLTAQAYIVRGYDRDERIIYGTGGVVPTPNIPTRCAELFGRADVAFIHVRSASNNCFHVRVERT